MKHNVIQTHNEQRFSSAIIKRELAALRREQSHLKDRSKERPLSDWEQARLRRIQLLFARVARKGASIFHVIAA